MQRGLIAGALVLAGLCIWYLMIQDQTGGNPAPPTAPETPPHSQADAPSQQVVPPAGAPADAPALAREDFNRLAVLQNLPLYWRGDTNNPGTLDAAELVVLRGDPVEWMADGSLTAAFSDTMGRLIEARRREAVALELNQGRITMVETDFSKLTEADRKVMRELQKVADLIDELYQQQTGALATRETIGADLQASQALYARNGGPECEAPQTSDDPFCSASPTFARPRSFAWPEGPTLDKAFCDLIGAEPNAKELLDPFTVVRKAPEGQTGYVALPYTAVYGERMKVIATALRAAAAALPEDEGPFRSYLEAAAQGFDTNQWWDADEAWSRMNARNSKWYLRVGPDETYFDPCQVKSGFHVSLARVDTSALEWQDKLTAIRQEMEETVAKQVGAPYAAREVGFQLPEFIEIIVNSGDSRSGQGATIGQSLPNFGPVAEGSRGRTVAMANLYTDPDSMRIARLRTESLFTEATAAAWTDDPSASRLDTVLHEAMHNVGPTGGWKVDGKSPEEVFGGRMDAILEELKAQTGSFFLLKYLKEKGLVTDAEVRAGTLSSIAWAFGHISRGLFTSEGKPRTYSVLAAMQVHGFMKAGALTYVDGQTHDPGRFEIVFEAMPAAIDAMMSRVGQIKATGDRAAAEAWIAETTSEEAQRYIRVDTIRERVLRYPKAAFVYNVVY